MPHGRRHGLGSFGRLPGRAPALRGMHIATSLTAVQTVPPPWGAHSLASISHHFTVDVEEYFQVAALAPYVSRTDWGTQESRVERSVEHLLDLLDGHGASGTFFVLGWVAERHPTLVRLIVERGFEVASHGWGHRRVTELTRDEFRDSVRRSKTTLQDLSGGPVLGYRAPNYSIVPGLEWALEILVEEGYDYDSSLFPVRRNGYGYPSGERYPHWLTLESGRLYEVPPSTVRWLGVNLPAAGGAYFRLLPYALVRSALRNAERHNEPATFYIHPWEIDAGQPRMSVPFITRVRHYGGLSRTLARLERLLSEFRFTSIARSIDAISAHE